MIDGPKPDENGWLVLALKPRVSGEHWIRIGNSIFIQFNGVRDGKARIAIQAPKDVSVVRSDAGAKKPKRARVTNCVKCQTPVVKGSRECPGCGVDL